MTKLVCVFFFFFQWNIFRKCKSLPSARKTFASHSSYFWTQFPRVLRLALLSRQRQRGVYDVSAKSAVRLQVCADTQDVHVCWLLGYYSCVYSSLNRISSRLTLFFSLLLLLLYTIQRNNTTTYLWRQCFSMHVSIGANAASSTTPSL